jgi:hypothetical protein
VRWCVLTCRRIDGVATGLGNMIIDRLKDGKCALLNEAKTDTREVAWRLHWVSEEGRLQLETDLL